MHWPTFGMAILAFAIMVSVRRFYPHLPYVLIAVVVTTLLAWLMGFAEHRTVDLKQIYNQNIRISLVRDGLQAQLIARQEEKFIEAQLRYNQSIANAEGETAELLALRQQLEQSRFLLAQLREQAQAEHKELYSQSLYAIGSGEQAKFFTRDELQKIAYKDNKRYGQDWHIVKYGNNQVELQAGGQVIGHVPRGLPGPRLPAFDLAAFKHLVGAALVISIIGFMEAISIARAIAAKTRQNLNTDRELIGQGMANIAGSLMQAYPSSGSFSRSAVNYNAGAVTASSGSKWAGCGGNTTRGFMIRNSSNISESSMPMRMPISRSGASASVNTKVTTATMPSSRLVRQACISGLTLISPATASMMTAASVACGR
jgi:SulP family sulfate permease